METGFLNKHDNEYFSSNIYDQSNGFESENSILNGLITDYDLESSPLNWTDNDNNVSDRYKEQKEDFQKTFQDWQNHITTLQFKDEDTSLKTMDSGIELLYEPIIDKMSDLFDSPKPQETSYKFTDEITTSSTDYTPEILISEENNSLPNNKFSTNDLGPDNYEVVEINIEEDDCSETVNVPHFNAVCNVSCSSSSKLNLSCFKSEEEIHSTTSKGSVTPQIKQVPQLSKKTIMDVLPKEVIDRIKESSKRRKCISLVPAERLSSKGNEHLKDDGAIKDINKSGKTKNETRGESVQLDHDYCSNNQAESTPKSKKNLLTPTKYEKNSKKDSGLESGEVSDASESAQDKRAKIKPGESLLKVNHLRIEKEDGIYNRQAEIGNSVEVPREVVNEGFVEVKEEPKKKKLNLEEYRSRRKNMKTRTVSPNNYDLNSKAKEPVTSLTENNSTRVMVNVQTQVGEKVQEESIKQDCEKRKARPKQRYRRRSSSSSSSSPGSRSQRHRGRSRSRRRRHSRSRQRSLWSVSRSRSISRSSASFNSDSSSSSRSHSRGRSSKRRRRSRSNYRRSSYSKRSRISSERSYRRQEDWSPVEKQKQVEERRVVYVGQIAEGTTKAQLRERFQTFGPIVDISLHFRERGDNYGFVTFMYKVDAYDAVEHGNDNAIEPRYDICFGGRRAFCKQRYADLDSTPQSYSPYQQNSRSNVSFDTLLREAKENLRKHHNKNV